MNRTQAGRAVVNAAGVVVLLVAAVIAVPFVAPTGRKIGARPRPLPLVTSSPNWAAMGAPAKGVWAPARAIDYTLAAPLPSLGSSAPVYRVLPAEAVHEATVRIADALALQGPVRDVGGGAQVSDGTHTLNVFKAGAGLEVSMFGGGAVSSGGTGVGVAPPPATSNQPEVRAPQVQAPQALPSAEAAQRIARRILERATVLDGAGWETDVTDGAGVVSAIACPIGASCPPQPRPVVTSRMVVFHRIVDGRRTAGLDWSVDVGDHGVVQSLSGTWARLELVAQYPLRAVADVYRDMVNGRAWHGRPMPLGASAVGGAPSIAVRPGTPLPRTRVTVTGVRLGATLMPAFEASASTAYVVPTYRFDGKYDTGAQWDAEVVALPSTLIASPKHVPDPPSARMPGRTDG